MARLRPTSLPTGTWRAASRRPATKPAFTLTELLIIVALLAVILTLNLPSLRKLSTKSELKDAARQVRASLLKTRLAAIESGRPSYFRYQPGGASFETGSGPKSAALPTQDDGLSALAEPSASGSNPSPLDQVEASQTLPSGVWFADPLADRQLAATAARSELLDDDSWSAPILIYPNGRTRNARIALVSEPYRIELTVRGLTGTVQISQVEHLPSAETATSEPLPEVLP